MSGIDNLVTKGYDLCFGDGIRDRAQGRKLLEEAASLGRADALFYLGKSHEFDGDYEAAEDAYLRGLDKRYRAAIFRLARLHGKGLVKDSDRDYFLRTMEALSRDGHFPSIALYTNERMRGSYGFAKQIVGFLSFIPNLIRFTWNFARDPQSHRFEQ